MRYNKKKKEVLITNKSKYYFVLQKKYGEIIDVFTFNKKEEMKEWKKRQKKMYGDDVQFLYTSWTLETWDEYESKNLGN